MKHVYITRNLLHENLSCCYLCVNSHEVYKSCLRQCIQQELETKCKTIVKQTCANSIDQMIDMYKTYGNCTSFTSLGNIACRRNKNA